jgi:hypothetical protein
MPKAKHDWSKLDPLIDNLKAQGWHDTQIAKDLGIGRQTLVDHLRSRGPVHQDTPKRTDITEEHQSTPKHLGTLERHQEVMEDVQQSVPEIPHIGTEDGYQSTSEHQSVHQQLDIPEEEHPSTPKVHQKASVNDSSIAHPGGASRQDQVITTPMVHPSTLTAEDWELWTTIKERWGEVEKMLFDRQSLLSTPGTPGNTQKKTYVFDVRHISLIDRYAQENRFELKDIIYMMCEEFFQRRKVSI